MDKILTYLDTLLDRSTPQHPMWNIEKLNEKPSWNYIDGCMIKAVLEMYAVTGKQKYMTFADEFVGFRVKEDGKIVGYDENKYNLDNINAGKNLFILYAQTGKEKYRRAIELLYHQILRQPRTKEGNFWHKLIYPNQVWLDGLYMALPFYMSYETVFNGRQRYNDIFEQFFLIRELMRDKKTGLYYHAFDSSKTMFWCDKKTGLSQNFWLRAIGWFAMAMLDTIEVCDTKGFENEVNQLRDNFRDLIEAMLLFQDESGMWYQVVDMAERKPNYLETSGSAIMAYAMLKGVRLGVLPAHFRQIGEHIMDGITKKYLTMEDGVLHLGGICLVGGLGGKQMRDGSFDYYMSEPIVSDDAKGVGPYMLAHIERIR